VAKAKVPSEPDVIIEPEQDTTPSEVTIDSVEPEISADGETAPEAVESADAEPAVAPDQADEPVSEPLANEEPTKPQEAEETPSGESPEVVDEPQTIKEAKPTGTKKPATQKPASKTTKDPKSESTETVEADQTATALAPKKKAALRRLWDWVRGVRPVVEKVEVAPVPEEKPLDLEKELKKKMAALIKAQRLSAREASEAQTLQARLDVQRDELDRVRSWVESLERSYFWNVRKRMAANISTANADLRAYEGAVNNVELPERGGLVELRQKFHKALGFGVLIFGIPTALLFVVPWFAKAAMPVWLLEFLGSEFFSLMVFVLVALASGIVGLIRRAQGDEKMSWWRMIRIVAVVFAIPMLVLGVARAQELLLVYVVPFIERWLATSLLVLSITFFFYLVGILAVYYSGWSAFSRQVTEQLTALANVVEGYVHSQGEIGRLEALYAQTADWLELLAHSLYRPWKVDPGWETTQELRLTSESFPFALRVAHAVDSETSQVANLERLIGQRLMTQGWRNEAFEDTLGEIGKQMGFDESHVTPEFLDADLPHQSNNSRALIRSFFEQSAATAEAGLPRLADQTGPTKDGHARFSDNYLVEVARHRLKELIEKTQSSVLSEARPEVEQIVEDPLQQIRFDSAVLDGERTSQDWDDFLRDALGYDEIVQPPLSTMTFTDEGALARNPEAAETHILIPERLKASAPQSESEKVKIHALPDTGSGRSVELIVRFDAVGPLPFSHVRMVENATYRPTLANTQSDDDDGEL